MLEKSHFYISEIKFSVTFARQHKKSSQSLLFLKVDSKRFSNKLALFC